MTIFATPSPMTTLFSLPARICRDITDVLLPRTCEVCGLTLVGDERVICAHCDADMPRTMWHLSDFNPIHQRIMGHAPVDRAAAMFHYSADGRYADLIRNAKYHGRPRLMRDLASIYARELTADRFFDGMDIIEPVPMSPLRRLIRGFNQTESLATGLGAETGLTVGDHLRARHHRHQVQSTASQRHANTRGTYTISRPHELGGLHILIVDDIITTGSTLHAIAELLHDTVSPRPVISILTLGATTLG